MKLLDFFQLLLFVTVTLFMKNSINHLHLNSVYDAWPNH